MHRLLLTGLPLSLSRSLSLSLSLSLYYICLYRTGQSAKVVILNMESRGRRVDYSRSL